MMMKLMDRDIKEMMLTIRSVDIMIYIFFSGITGKAVRASNLFVCRVQTKKYPAEYMDVKSFGGKK